MGNEIGGVLVDSGTTLIYLPSTVSQAIETEIDKSVPDLKTTFFEWSTCVTESELDSFPDLTIALNDYNLKLKPKQYLLWRRLLLLGYLDIVHWHYRQRRAP